MARNVKRNRYNKEIRNNISIRHRIVNVENLFFILFTLSNIVVLFLTNLLCSYVNACSFVVNAGAITWKIQIDRNSKTECKEHDAYR